MKFRPLFLTPVLALCAVSVGCGAGHPTIASITVSPGTATAPINPPTDVQFTATATFDNNSSRELTVADGLTWTTSSSTIATISTGGSATCLAVGQVTVTATAPSQLNLTINNGINNTSQNVAGTAQLSCLPSP